MEASKVRTLLRAIMDPKLQEAKAVVQGIAEYRNNFEAAHNFLNGQLTLRQSITMDTRNISLTQWNNDNNSSRGRGRGNSTHGGRGRGGHGGRGRGRGRGRGHQQNQGRYSTSGQFLNNGFYTADIWNTFNADEQQHVWDLRAARPTTRQLTPLHSSANNNTNSNNSNAEATNANLGDSMTRRQTRSNDCTGGCRLDG